MKDQKQIDKYNLIQTLTLVSKNDKLQSLHSISKGILKMSSLVMGKYKSKPLDQEKNQIRINGRFFTLNKKTINGFMVDLHDYNDHYFKRKENKLKKSILIIKDSILNDKPIKPYYLEDNNNNDLEDNSNNNIILLLNQLAKNGIQ